jgi:DNA-nicking Smr family endonuclease
LDLHGVSVENLHSELARFYWRCAENKTRYAIVITGKGRGIVKTVFLQWLQSSGDITGSFSPMFDSSLGVGSYLVEWKQFPKFGFLQKR